MMERRPFFSVRLSPSPASKVTQGILLMFFFRAGGSARSLTVYCFSETTKKSRPTRIFTSRRNPQHRGLW